MRSIARFTVAAVAALALTGGAVSAMADTTPAPTVPMVPTHGTAVCRPPAATLTCSPSGGGYTVRHSLGRVPTAVLVTLAEPYVGFTSYRATSSTVTVYVRRPNGTLYTGPVTFSWSVAG